MSIKSQFLTLSMKEQISLTILFLTIFSLIVIISIIGTLTYQILKDDYKQKKLYFFIKYKEYMENSFYFQNFYLLQYEEIIKRVQKEIWVFHQIMHKYKLSNFKQFNNNNNNTKIIDFLKLNATNNTENDINDNLYYLCFTPDNRVVYDKDTNLSVLDFFNCDFINSNIFSVYEAFSSLIITHNIEAAFRLPGYDIPIINPPIFVFINRYFNYIALILLKY